MSIKSFLAKLTGRQKAELAAELQAAGKRKGKKGRRAEGVEIVIGSGDEEEETPVLAPVAEEDEETPAAEDDEEEVSAEDDEEMMAEGEEGPPSEEEEDLGPPEPPEDDTGSSPRARRRSPMAAKLARLEREQRALKAQLAHEKYRKEASRLMVAGAGQDDLARILARVDRNLPKREAAQIRRILASSSEVNRRSALFGALGRAVGGDASSPQGQIQAKAQAIRAAQPKLTQAQAIVRALEENPELYDSHVYGGS